MRWSAVASPDLTSAEPVGGDAPQQVAYETLDEGRIARIWLNRPEAQNAQSRTLLVQLDEAFGRAEADDAVRVVILAARGKNFSAGHDLGSEEALLSANPVLRSIRHSVRTVPQCLRLRREPICRSGTTSSRTPVAGGICARSRSRRCRATRY